MKIDFRWQTRSENSLHSVARQSLRAKWRRWLTSSAQEPPPRQSSRWHRWSCSCPRPVAPHCSQDTELEGFSLVLPSASGTIVLLRRRERRLGDSELRFYGRLSAYHVASGVVDFLSANLSVARLVSLMSSSRFHPTAPSAQSWFSCKCPCEYERGETGFRRVQLSTIHGSLTSKCWQWSAPPFHSETRDTCGLASSDRGRRKRSHCTRKWENKCD